MIQRWGETPTWQYFSGNEYFEHQWPCDPTQMGRFRKALGKEGVEELLARTMEVAVTRKLIAKKELTRVIVDSTVQEKAISHPTDSKLLETARSKVVEAAKANRIELKQTYERGPTPRLQGWELRLCASIQMHAQSHQTPTLHRRAVAARGRVQDEHAQPSHTRHLGPNHGQGQTHGHADDKPQSGGQPRKALQLACARGGVDLKRQEPQPV